MSVRLKNILEKIKEKRINKKYINNTIKAHIVKDIDESEYEKEKFLKELKEGIEKKEKINQILPDKQFEIKIQKNEIGE